MSRADDIKFDFSPKNGWILGAVLYFFAILMMFVIIPYMVYSFAASALSETDVAVFGSTDLRNIAWEWVSNMMKYAIPLVLLAIPIGFYRKGSYARIPFKIIFALYLASWLWIASHGGIFTAAVEDVDIGGALSAITLGLNIRTIVYVNILICIAMAFLAFTEFAGNRKKYFEKLDKKKDTMSKRKARRLSEKG